MPSCPKITRKLLSSLEPARPRYYMLESGSSPGSVKGFGVRVGRSTLVYGLRFRGQWHTIGRADVVPLEDAREIARQKLLILTAPQAATKILTVGKLFERFWRQHSPEWSPGTQHVNLSVWNNHILPRWRRRRLDELPTTEIEDMTHQIAKSSARKAVQQLGAAYEYAITLGWITRSPVRLKGPAVPPRARRATSEELRTIGKALEDLEAEGKDPRPLAVFWTVLFTGCRPGEVLRAKLEQAELEGDSPCIIWEPGTAKDRQRARYIWLPKKVAQRLKDLPRPEGSPWLIPGDAPGQPYKSAKHQWRQLCKGAGIEDLQLRDLRAAVRSELETAGAPLGHVQALLGHRPGSRTTNQVYLRPNAEEARAAGELLERRLKQLMDDEEEASSVH